jgi:hypothetical protein
MTWSIFTVFVARRRSHRILGERLDAAERRLAELEKKIEPLLAAEEERLRRRGLLTREERAETDRRMHEHFAKFPDLSLSRTAH